MSTEKRYKLKAPIIGVREFERQAAINLLTMTNNGGWECVNKKDLKDLLGEADSSGNTGSDQEGQGDE